MKLFRSGQSQFGHLLHIEFSCPQVNVGLRCTVWFPDSPGITVFFPNLYGSVSPFPPSSSRCVAAGSPL